MLGAWRVDGWMTPLSMPPISGNMKNKELNQKFSFISAEYFNTLRFQDSLPSRRPVKGTNLDDIELLRPAGARPRVKAKQAVTQDSPGHPRSIPAQSQLKSARSMEGHQFPFKLKAILKSKQSPRGLRWFNGSYQQPVRLKMEAGPLRATLVGLPGKKESRFFYRLL